MKLRDDLLQLTASGVTGKQIELRMPRDATVRELVSRALPRLPSLQTGADKDEVPVAYHDRLERDLDPSGSLGDLLEDRDHVRLIPPSIAGGC